jgi:hypothetical protein
MQLLIAYTPAHKKGGPHASNACWVVPCAPYAADQSASARPAMFSKCLVLLVTKVRP